MPCSQTTGALAGDWATHAGLFTAFLVGYLRMAEETALPSVDRQ